MMWSSGTSVALVLATMLYQCQLSNRNLLPVSPETRLTVAPFDQSVDRLSNTEETEISPLGTTAPRYQQETWTPSETMPGLSETQSGLIVLLRNRENAPHKTNVQIK